MLDVIIRDLILFDLHKDDFYITLEHLSPTRPFLPGYAENIFWERKQAGIRTLVAVFGDKVIGTASFILESKFLHGGSYVCHIEDVATHPEYCGHGIASKLIQHINEIAVMNKCYKVILDCDDALVPFYEKQGFYLNCNAMRMNIKDE